MDNLAKNWSKLSLDIREGGGFHLTKERGSKEFIIAAKFLTKQVLNAESIIRTLSPLWRDRNGFEVRSTEDHVVLFVFEEETKVKKILAREPWSFDKNLVILQRYEKTIPIKELVFNSLVIGPSSWSSRVLYETRCCWRNMWGCRSGKQVTEGLGSRERKVFTNFGICRCFFTTMLRSYYFNGGWDWKLGYFQVWKDTKYLLLVRLPESCG